MNLSSIKPNFSTANTANTLVQRDAGGDIFVGDITATTFTGKLAPTVITGETAITDAASDDVVLLYDTSAAGLRKITVDNLMRKINNVPYAEYAFSTNPSYGGFLLTENTLVTCPLNAEVQDIGSIGSLAANEITLDAGTYMYEIYVPLYISTSYASVRTRALLYLRNVTSNTLISIKANENESLQSYSSNSYASMNGNFTVTQGQKIRIEIQVGSIGGGGAYIGWLGAMSSTTAGTAFATTIKLWKVG